MDFGAVGTRGADVLGHVTEVPEADRDHAIHQDQPMVEGIAKGPAQIQNVA